MYRVDDALIDRLERDLIAAEGQLEAARLRGDLADDVLTRIDEIESLIDAEMTTFTFTAMSALDWQNLVAAHPPTSAEASQGRQWSDRTFIPAVIAASMTSPQMTSADVELLASEVSIGVWNELSDAAVGVNIDRGGPPKSLMAGLVRRVNERSATTHANEASPAPFS